MWYYLFMHTYRHYARVLGSMCWGQPLVAWLLVVTTAFAEPGARTWTDSSGRFSREGRLLRTEGDLVVLENSDGKTLKIPLERLSEKDQAYIRSAAQHPADPFAVESSGLNDANTREERGSPGVAGAISDGADNVRVVVVEGVGLNVTEAKADAYREAVRQIVGAYVEGDTVVENDVIIEDSVIALSGGFVRRADVLSTSANKADGLIRAKVRAEVRVTEVMAALRKINVSTVSVRGSDLESQQVTLADQAEAASAAIGRESLWSDAPASFFSLRVVGEPKATAANKDEATLSYELEFAPDLERYQAFADRLIAILGRSTDLQGEFANNGRPPEGQRNAAWDDLVHSPVGIARAFPERDRPALLRQFKDVPGPQGGSRASPWVVCQFDGVHSKINCGLGEFIFPWREALRQPASLDRCYVCVMSKSDKTWTRTKWRWFAAPNSEVIVKNIAARQKMSCEVAILADEGKEIVSDVFSLGGGLGFCRDQSGSTAGANIYFISPFFLGPNSDLWMRDYCGYVARFRFSRTCEVAADDVSSIKSFRCSVKLPTAPEAK
jgi:hypothetical protein